MVTAKSTEHFAKVAKELRQRGKNTVDAYITLKKIVERHEATIQTRWLEMTPQERVEILLNVWPNLPTSHQPGIKDLCLILAGKERLTYWQRMDVAWPFISQEDLSTPRTLLLLLKSRGRNHPQVFAPSDAMKINFSEAFGEHNTQRLLPGYTVKLAETLTGTQYGTLVDLSKPPSREYRWLEPGLTFVVFAMQERLLKFLASVCRFALHDIAPGPMIANNKAYPVQPESRLVMPAGTGPLDSITAFVAEANYRVPGIDSLDHFVSLLAAQKSAVEERIVALREDPGFFAATVQTLREHHTGNVRHVDDRRHPFLEDELIPWESALARVVTSLNYNEVYTELYAQAQKFHRLHRKHVSEQQKKASNEYLYSLGLLHNYFRTAVGFCIRDLKASFFGSPPVRNRSVFSSDQIERNPKFMSPYSKGSKKEQAADTLFRALPGLWNRKYPHHPATLLGELNEVQRAMDRENIGVDMVTPYIASVIGELSVIAHCNWMMFEMDLADPKILTSVAKAANNEFDAKFAPCSQLKDAMDDKLILEHAVPRIIPTDGRFAYPVDKPRTKEVVEAIRRAEDNLDEFWDYIDRAVYSKIDGLEGTTTHRLLREDVGLRRTRSWTGDADAAATKPQVQPLSPYLHGLYKDKRDAAEKETPGSNESSGVSSAGSDASSTGSCCDSADASVVDARAFEVFRALFFVPGGNTTFAEVPWSDFLHAMSSVGLQGEKLHGSLWHFRLVMQDDTGEGPGLTDSIQLNDPFPRNELSFEEARYIGRRLGNTFGWNRHTFVAKSE